MCFLIGGLRRGPQRSEDTRRVAALAPALDRVQESSHGACMRRSAARIHDWWPSGPRTRPHHSPCSRTQ
jgi:hypothetical protein